MQDTERTIIIGAGHGGSQCAISLRAANYDGEIVLIDADDAELPYHKPPLSKKYLLSEDQTAVPLRSASAYEKADVVRVSDTVTSIDTDQQVVSMSNGSDIFYSQLVLATGANNRSLQALTGLSNVHSVRTLLDSRNLRDVVLSTQRIEILGGGFIGLEIAACLAAMGKDVTVLEAADRVLGRVVSSEVSDIVQEKLRQLGINVITGRMASGFNSDNGQLTSVSLDNGDTIDTELMVVGIGAVPNDSVALQAGIACDNGVLVNVSLRTGTTNVFAIGDCARFPHWQTKNPERLESVQNAVDQAKHVATQIAEKTELAYQMVPWFWSDIGPLKLQIAGIRQGDTEVVTRTEDDKFALYHLQEGRVVCVETINNAKDHMVARKLIGSDVHVTAEDIVAGADALKALLD
ncbi:FAD-dependent oxidoreductase [Granulosicoccus sp.]|nr:FAD-dependent oxidoreductase [Granulosicoccus sp.]MDB4223887.1 FAD-dependent oxidoreductase [Granulosicoccus sp.]